MSSNESNPELPRIPRLLSRREGQRRRILLVAAASFPADQLDATLRSYASLDAEVRIVAPASNISRLDWLTNDEDSARAEAAERAERVAERVPADVTRVEVGDTDPIQAVEDALRVFCADEMIVLRGPEDADWNPDDATERKHFDVPVTQVVVEPRAARRAEG
jgi:hypothetical protein